MKKLEQLEKSDHAEVCSDAATFETLKQALVLSIDRLDSRVVHVKWMPTFEAILAALISKGKVISIDYWVLYNIYKVCMSTDKEKSSFVDQEIAKKESCAVKTLETFWKRIEVDKDFVLAEQDIPVVTYLVSISTKVDGSCVYDFTVDDTPMKMLVAENGNLPRFSHE